MKPETILGLSRKFMESRIFLTAAELDIFSLLINNPMSAQEVADKIQVTLRGISILLNALVPMGLLEKKDKKYYCPAEVGSLLSEDSPTSIKPMVMLTVGGWQRWSDLTEIVRKGAQKARPRVFESSETEQEAFIGAMHAIAHRIAPRIIATIKPGEAKKLLDIGGASGSYTEAFLEASPDMKATLFDLPSVIKIAQRRLANTDLLDRITFIAGDYNKDELPAGHDLALLSAIIHQNSPEQNIELYGKIYRALQPGGRLVIRDHVMSPDHTQPASGALFAVNMLVGTPGGSTYSFEEIKAPLESAGFINIRLIQPDEQMSGLVEGFKK
jgi:ubiquinone/menaquinone biosynthesis C-methylase UbiE